MKVNVKLVTRRKAQKNTGSATAQNGARLDGRFRRPSESGSKKQRLKRKSGSGQEVSLRTLSVQANGTGVTSVCKSGSLRSTKAVAYCVEVEHVKAHRTKKDKKEMSHFERFVNEKADELAKAGAMLDAGFMAEARAETMKQEREEVFAALQYAASFHCLVEERKV